MKMTQKPQIKMKKNHSPSLSKGDVSSHKRQQDGEEALTKGDDSPSFQDTPKTSVLARGCHSPDSEKQQKVVSAKAGHPKRVDTIVAENQDKTPIISQEPSPSSLNVFLSDYIEKQKVIDVIDRRIVEWQRLRNKHRLMGRISVVAHCQSIIDELYDIKKELSLK